MLTTLNEILNEAPDAAEDWMLWRQCDGSNGISLKQFVHELGSLRQKIEAVPNDRWLLYTDDQHYFLLGLLTLLGLKKKVILCANRKPSWLQGLGSEYDSILSDEIEDPAFSGTGKVCVDFDLGPVADGPWRPLFDGREEIIFYTSGSTGYPKPVVKSLLSLVTEAGILKKIFYDDIHSGLFVSSVSHLHIYGLLFKILLPIYVRGSSINVQIAFPEQLSAIEGMLGEDHKKILVSSPAFLSRIDLNLPPSGINTVFSSGGLLSYTAAKNARRYFRHLPIEVYGSTETGGVGYRRQTQDSAAWNLFPGMKFFEQEDGVEISSPYLERRYMLDDDLEILSDGRFRLRGRKDKIIKVAEKRVSLTEIELFLITQPEIRQCTAVLLSGKRDILGCAVVLSDHGVKQAAETGHASLIKGWKKSMQARFEAVIIPKKWRILEEMPVNSQSKIDLSSLVSEFSRGTGTS